MTDTPFNPLDKRNLAESVMDALLGSNVHPLPPAKSFSGAGIYVIYYSGNFGPYKPVAERNRNGCFEKPIYVGKAVPAGARKGGYDFSEDPKDALYKRLKEHAESIEQASNLALKDFNCRHLAVDDIWIPLGESLLIESFKPLWNKLLDGYGNHDPGKGRYEQKRSPWDLIHPGRAWAERLKPNEKTRAEWEAKIREYLKKHA